MNQGFIPCSENVPQAIPSDDRAIHDKQSSVDWSEDLHPDILSAHVFERHTNEHQNQK